MECPYCAHTASKVTDKRGSPDGIRRRRECLNAKCKRRFTTYERVEKSELFVIKKDGRRERFETAKLAGGIERAFEKRPVSKDAIDRLIAEVEDALRRKAKGREIKSSVIGETVMKKIGKLDKVAYVRFASVYKDFHDLKDFRKELRELQ